MGRISLKYLIFQFFLITVTPQVFAGKLAEQSFCLLKMTKGNSRSMGRNNAAWIFPKWMFSRQWLWICNVQGSSLQVAFIQLFAQGCTVNKISAAIIEFFFIIFNLRKSIKPAVWLELGMHHTTTSASGICKGQFCPLETELSFAYIGQFLPMSSE